MEVPYWLCSQLAKIYPDSIEIALPEIFSPNFQSILNADPLIVNIKEKTPFYYELGIKIVELVNINSKQENEILL
jgi:hypothetical protein